MIGTLRHRGPDGFGVYRDETVGLTNARLAIVDLQGGWQPIANEDETVWIVFNGEIFNHLDLRRELEGKGHRFRTHSDTETIVHAYEEWGTGAFARFNGDWALAIWDTRQRRLVLSRDRVGVKPLFYREADGRLWFGSEVKAIFADPSVPRHFDVSGIEQVFTYWSTIAPTTVFEGIKQLPPASIRIYNADGGIREDRYWEPEFPQDGWTEDSRTLDETALELRQKLEVATRKRLDHADVPVGAYLSGGLDSSSVVALAKAHAKDTFKSLSVRFTLDEYDESRYQQMVVDQVHRDHHSVLVRPEDIADVFPEVIRHCESPILRTAPAPLYLLAREARRQGLKVVLTGEGADEFLGGYDIFKEAKILSFWSRQPDSTVRPQLFNRLYGYMARGPQHAGSLASEFWRQGLQYVGTPAASHYLRWHSTSLLKGMFSQDVRREFVLKPPYIGPLTYPEAYSGWEELGRAQYLEITTLLPGYILSSQGDRMLMAHSVEGRFPFLDVDVMDFSNALAPQHKLLGLHEKLVLKRALSKDVPAPILKRTKQPYRAPEVQRALLERSADYLSPDSGQRALVGMGLLDASAVGRLFRKLHTSVQDQSGPVQFSNAQNMAFIGVFSLVLLHEAFLSSAQPAVPDRLHFQVTRDFVGPNQNHVSAHEA